MSFDMNAFKQAQELAERLTKEMQAAQDQLISTESAGSSGDGDAYVRITMNGQYMAQKVEVSTALIETVLEGISLSSARISNISASLGTFIKSAINDTVQKVSHASRKKLGELAAAIQPNFTEGNEEEKE